MYDARSKVPGGNESILFSIIALVVVALAFVGAWFAAGAFGANGGGAGKLAQAASAAYTPSASLAEVMTTPDEQRLLAAAYKLDGQAVARLEAAFEVGGSREDEIEAVGVMVSEVTMSNFDHLAHVSSADLNRMLETAMRQVGALQRSGSPLCSGRTYAALEGADEARLRAAMANMGITVESAYLASVQYQADILEMIVRAKRSPTRHGKMNSRDERVVQDVTMTLFMDPVLMGAMSASSPSDIANIDVCDAGMRLLKIVEGIPDDTKGRAWAAAFGSPELQGMVSQMNSFVNAGS